jgi:hypothetical protein
MHHLIAVVTFITQVVAAPTPSKVGYVPEPGERGTVSLVSTCFATMILCVWTAIHANVFPEKTLLWNRFWRKVTGGAVVALLAPEIILWRAIVQFKEATLLRKAINNVTTLTPRGNQRKPWNLMHGHFAAMGGYVINLDDFTDEHKDLWFLEPERRCTTFTPAGILRLAEVGLLQEVQLRTISGRSKTDGLSKALVCFQVGWMVIQLLARVASRLPIALLELHTAAHVVCSAILYLVWWYKPQNVDQPIKITLEPSEAVTVLYPGSYELEVVEEQSEPGYSETGLNEKNTLTEKTQNIDTELGLSPPGNNQSGFRVLGNTKKGWNRPNPVEPKQLEIEKRCWEQSGIVLLPGQYLEGVPLTPTQNPRCLLPNDITTLQIINKNKNVTKIKDQWKHYTKDKAGVCLTNKSFNGRIDGSLSGDRDLPPVGLGIFLGAIYCGMHATAWNAEFPTILERTLWRTAVCIAGLGTLVHCFFWHYMPIARYFCGERLSQTNAIGPLRRLAETSLGASLCVCILSRLYLVIEAIIQVRSLSEGVYQTVRWVAFLPHFG